VIVKRVAMRSVPPRGRGRVKTSVAAMVFGSIRELRTILFLCSYWIAGNKLCRAKFWVIHEVQHFVDT
jgi:hypothetical protein